MAKQVKEKRDLFQVKIDQSRSEAKIILRIKGDVEVTGPKVQEIVSLLAS
ncbi:MAG: hypothetical protein ACD_37C00161G0003 [uncultured bacterium]|nr:MAG: hypothetical protein ACD_37C00161G0003 [uncultured bacterium]